METARYNYGKRARIGQWQADSCVNVGEKLSRTFRGPNDTLLAQPVTKTANLHLREPRRFFAGKAPKRQLRCYRLIRASARERSSLDIVLDSPTAAEERGDNKLLEIGKSMPGDAGIGRCFMTPNLCVREPRHPCLSSPALRYIPRALIFRSTLHGFVPKILYVKID